jgi:hypothetical protein
VDVVDDDEARNFVGMFGFVVAPSQDWLGLNVGPATWLSIRDEIHVGIGCTITERLTLSTQLTNGHFNCLLNGRDRFKFFLTWPTGE